VLLKPLQQSPGVANRAGQLVLGALNQTIPAAPAQGCALLHVPLLGLEIRKILPLDGVSANIDKGCRASTYPSSLTYGAGLPEPPYRYLSLLQRQHVSFGMDVRIHADRYHCRFRQHIHDTV
jgi:hypothetical protein